MCKFCESQDFLVLNPIGFEYTGIEMGLDNLGMLRVRVYTPTEDEERDWELQDIVNINFCPVCGRPFNASNNRDRNGAEPNLAQTQ